MLVGTFSSGVSEASGGRRTQPVPVRRRVACAVVPIEVMGVSEVSRRKE